MSLFKYVVMQASNKKRYLWLLLIIFFLLISLFVKVSLMPESRSYFDYLFQLTSGKAYFSLIIPVNLLILQKILIEWHSFVLIRTSRWSIVKQNLLTIVCLTFIEAFICIGILLLLSILIPHNFVLVNLWLLSAISGSLLFFSMLTLSLVYYSFSVLIRNSSISLIILIVTLLISSFFSNPMVHGVSELFQIDAEKVANGDYILGKIFMMGGICLGAVFITTWLFTRREYLAEVSA